MPGDECAVREAQRGERAVEHVAEGPALRASPDDARWYGTQVGLGAPSLARSFTKKGSSANFEKG